MYDGANIGDAMDREIQYFVQGWKSLLLLVNNPCNCKPCPPARVNLFDAIEMPIITCSRWVFIRKLLWAAFLPSLSDWLSLSKVPLPTCLTVRIPHFLCSATLRGLMLFEHDAAWLSSDWIFAHVDWGSNVLSKGNLPCYVKDHWQEACEVVPSCNTWILPWSIGQNLEINDIITLGWHSRHLHLHCLTFFAILKGSIYVSCLQMVSYFSYSIPAWDKRFLSFSCEMPILEGQQHDWTDFL